MSMAFIEGVSWAYREVWSARREGKGKEKREREKQDTTRTEPASWNVIVSRIKLGKAACASPRCLWPGRRKKKKRGKERKGRGSTPDNSRDIPLKRPQREGTLP